MTKSYNVTAEVHKKLNHGGYRVKVSIPELGMYINGVVVFPPNDVKPKWYVQPPSQPAGRGKWAHIVEFNKKLPLWAEVYDTCVEAVKADPQYIEEEFDTKQAKDVVLTDISDEPIDFSGIDIPF